MWMRANTSEAAYWQALLEALHLFSECDESEPLSLSYRLNCPPRQQNKYHEGT